MLVGKLGTHRMLYPLGLQESVKPGSFHDTSTVVVVVFVTKPTHFYLFSTLYSYSTNSSDHFAYHIVFLCYHVTRSLCQALLSGSALWHVTQPYDQLLGSCQETVPIPTPQHTLNTNYDRLLGSCQETVPIPTPGRSLYFSTFTP